MKWEVQRSSGKVSELHQQSAALVAADEEPLRGRRIAIVHSPLGRALVLGSAQPVSTVDLGACAAAGAEVVRRRSGGGAVLVDPGSVVWVDLVVGATDPLWCEDVGRATWWAGEAWAQGLLSAGIGGPGVWELRVWKGPMVRNAWSSLICFAGLGPGEVVGGEHRKVVGISQRRTRHGALFQCACLLRWEPERLLALLALTDDERETAARELSGAGLGVGPDRAGAALDGLLAALP